MLHKRSKMCVQTLELYQSKTVKRVLDNKNNNQCSAVSDETISTTGRVL